MSTFNPAGGGTYYLGNSIGSTDTTILLSSFLEPVSGVAYTMVLLNTSIAYATIAPGTTSSEFISFTGITQNANGTATLTGVTRGLQKKYPFTTSVTFKLPHSGQSIFILSDAPQVFASYGALANDQTWGGINTFTLSPIAPDPTTAQQVATKNYVDSAIVGIVGTATNTSFGTVKLSVVASSAPNPIVVGDNDPRVPTQGENDALVGTSGTPSSLNKYVTNDDTSATLSGSKLIRASGGVYPAGDGSAITGVGKTADVQIFTSGGTWTKPTGAKIVEIVVIGAGGSGGSGGQTGSGSGGSGGGSGATGRIILIASSIGSTETITVGTGGTGPAGTVVAAGTNGANGGSSTFGTWLFAGGGGGGQGGVAGAGSQGGGGGGLSSSASGTTAGTPAATTTSPILGQAIGSWAAQSTAVAVAGGSSEWGGASGGGGQNGGGGTIGGSSLFGAGAGGAGGGAGGSTGGQGGGPGKYGGNGTTPANTNGSDNSTLKIGYGGAGGGGGSSSSTGQAGGNGGIAGGGGGGGGVGSAATGGKGGDGGRGEVRVYTYF